MQDVQSLVEAKAAIRRPSGAGALRASIIVPVYNEMHRLPGVLPEILDLADDDTEVIFVDDGSRDGTPGLLSGVSAPNVTTLHLRRNQGKGAAVRAGASVARGHAVVFMDADLATDVACLEPLVGALEFAHVAIGSRAHPKSVVRDTTRRRSRMGGKFNGLTRRITGTEYWDTQCGFKAFRAEVAGVLFHLARVDGFAFDVELLCLARTLQMRVAEVPVVWRERPGSKIRVVRDPARMTFDVLATRMRNAAHAPITVCRVDPGVDNAEAAAGLLRQNLRCREIVTSGDGEVRIYLPGTSAAAAESVMARVRNLLPGADARIASEPTCDAWRSFDGHLHVSSPRRDARPAVSAAIQT